MSSRAKDRDSPWTPITAAKGQHESSFCSVSSQRPRYSLTFRAQTYVLTGRASVSSLALEGSRVHDPRPVTEPLSLLFCSRDLSRGPTFPTYASTAFYQRRRTICLLRISGASPWSQGRVRRALTPWWTTERGTSFRKQKYIHIEELSWNKEGTALS